MECINLLYNNIIGRRILSVLIKPKVTLSVGRFMDRRASKVLIPIFIKKNKINMQEYEKVKYASFNEFFCRRIKKEFRPIDFRKDMFIAPCDGLLSAYHIEDGLVIPVKQSSYSITDLLRDSELAQYYDGGICLVYRLCVDNYHRYCYSDDGIKGTSHYIPGVLHTVRPIAHEHLPVFVENTREYVVIDTNNFGRITQMEVGALLVGKIENNKDSCKVFRGQEKGHFEYGGSTIIQLIQPNQVKITEKLFKATAHHKEVPVKMGQHIGRKLYK